mmetsp:Transcript_1040/g.4286  ORF Transcript_1040/g.4286 Transcript_1040/m.4286 type:complete len:216 (+) Transcript_1040:513-1160(+)
MVQSIVPNLVPEHRDDLILVHQRQQRIEEADAAEASETRAEGIAVLAASRAVDDEDAGTMVAQPLGKSQQLLAQQADIHASASQTLGHQRVGGGGGCTLCLCVALLHGGQTLNRQRPLRPLGHLPGARHLAGARRVDFSAALGLAFCDGPTCTGRRPQNGESGTLARASKAVVHRFPARLVVEGLSTVKQPAGQKRRKIFAGLAGDDRSAFRKWN